VRFDLRLVHGDVVLGLNPLDHLRCALLALSGPVIVGHFLMTVYDLRGQESEYSDSGTIVLNNLTPTHHYPEDLSPVACTLKGLHVHLDAGNRHLC
jgi:hypothetical protein